MSASGERAGAAVLIGIGDYLRSEQVWPLRYAARDAEAMAEVLIDPETCSFPARNVKLLKDLSASRDAVAHHLSKWLPEQARGAEVAVIYFAGHGTVHRIGQREEGYLLPYDADPQDLVTHGVLMADLARWIEAIEAGAVVLCLDCCHAAKVIPRGHPGSEAIGRDMRIRPAILQQLTGRGRYLIASCDDGQVSLEAETWGHGLFTYHLLDGIRGAGDRDCDGRVGVAELFEHVAESVEREARVMGVTQKPWSCSIGAGGVYLSAPLGKRDQGRPKSQRSAAVLAAERLWREQGAASAVDSLERAVDWADVGQLISMLDLLRGMERPEAIPLLFRCLAHTCEEVRARAKKVVQAFGWERVTTFVEVLAAQGDGEQIGAVLDGVAAFEAHLETVTLLNRLVTLLKGDVRNRTILLLERKQQALDLERIADLFRESASAFRIQRPLGQGLSTAAYLARDESSELNVVVRVLRPELANLPQVRAQFLDLSRRSIRLVHHNLVLTREVRSFPERNIYYAVRDYVEGITLQKLLESRRDFSPDQILKIIRELLHALSPIHSRAMAHGSIKPSNIFLCGEDRVVLGDLALPLRGVSLQLDRLSYDFRYAAPEMFRQGGIIGPRADFYSLGCVAYELACGAPPFVSDNHFELAGLHDREPVEPPSQRCSRLGPSGDTLLLRLLAKSPSDRLVRLDAAHKALDDLQDALGPKAKPEAPLAPILAEESMIRYATDPMESAVSFTTDPRLVYDTPPYGIKLGSEPIVADETLPTGIDSDWKRRRIDTDRVPTKIGRYVIVRALGRGGMSSVYLAQDESLERSVAIKLHVWGPRAGPDVLTRFRREAMAVARLTHPNIVSIYDVGEQDGLLYVVLQYVDGGDLGQKMTSGPWQPDEAARLIATLARAVDHAHSVGIIHRDLKPSNILLTKEDTPLISDFGLAKLIGEQQQEAAETRVGMVLGTPAYMAPEQASGAIKRIGPATDIYSLGAMLYELLAGRRPFVGGTPLEMLMQVREAPPEPPTRWRPDLPRDFDAICMKCLQKDPGRRYPSAAALAEDLERFLAGRPVHARQESIWEGLRRRLPFMS
jgi:serine/threonine protein kinase